MNVLIFGEFRILATPPLPRACFTISIVILLGCKVTIAKTTENAFPRQTEPAVFLTIPWIAISLLRYRIEPGDSGTPGPKKIDRTPEATAKWSASDRHRPWS